MPTTSPGAPGSNPFDQARIAARELARMTGADHHDVLIVLGTGLFAAAEQLGAHGAPVDLTSLPWFARFTGPGHRPEAWSVDLEGKRALVVAGRLHLYEGRSAAEVVHPIRMAIAAGVTTVVLTCSAGSVNPALVVGEVVAIRDHLNLTGTSPLFGVPAEGPTGSRHVDLTDAWSPQLRALARAVVPINEGVYAQMPGPQLETPAEIRMLAALGADLVGMSTVPEVIASRHLGAHVLGLAVVTNTGAGSLSGHRGVEEVMRVASGAVPTVAKLVTGVVGALEPPPRPGGTNLEGGHASSGSHAEGRQVPPPGD